MSDPLAIQLVAADVRTLLAKQRARWVTADGDTRLYAFMDATQVVLDRKRLLRLLSTPASAKFILAMPPTGGGHDTCGEDVASCIRDHIEADILGWMDTEAGDT